MGVVGQLQAWKLTLARATVSRPRRRLSRGRRRFPVGAMVVRLDMQRCQSAMETTSRLISSSDERVSACIYCLLSFCAKLEDTLAANPPGHAFVGAFRMRGIDAPEVEDDVAKEVAKTMSKLPSAPVFKQRTLEELNQHVYVVERESRDELVQQIEFNAERKARRLGHFTRMMKETVDDQSNRVKHIEDEVCMSLDSVSYAKTFSGFRDDQNRFSVVGRCLEPYDRCRRCEERRECRQDQRRGCQERCQCCQDRCR